ncbi:MAG: hypothetical protein JW894_02920 [Bacteroidales bacterium]|nr:hypothetical protein [Bacteroidales bacterium]
MLVNSRWVHTHIDRVDIIEYKQDEIDRNRVIFKPGSSYIDYITKGEIAYQHGHRYIFAPSAFNLKEGEFYYTNINIFEHDLQIGLSDNFSLGFGTSAFFFPIHVMPTFTHTINDKSAFAIGDLMIFFPHSDIPFFGNLFYGLYTSGTPDNNFSAGLGLWATIDNDLFGETYSPIINISAC